MVAVTDNDISDLIEWLDIEAIASRTPDYDRQNFQAVADILRMLMAASPVMWMYRWKVDYVYTQWRLTDRTDRSEYARRDGYQEIPLYGGPHPGASPS